MEQECPTVEFDQFAVILLSAYLSGGYAYQGSFLIAVAAASVCESVGYVAVHEQPVHSVAVESVGHRRDLGVVDNADKRMAARRSDIRHEIVGDVDFQYLLHTQR